MSPSCFGRAGIEGLAGHFRDFRFQRRGALREAAGQARQDLPVGADAALLHAGEHRHQRPLQPLVDRAQAFGGEPRLQHAPEPERHVGILGGVFGHLVDRAGGDRLQRLAGAAELLVADRLVAEKPLGQFVHAVALERRRGVERVGNQHGVVERGDGDAVPEHDEVVVLEVLADLQDAGILQHRLQEGERVAERHLRPDAGLRLVAGEEVAGAVRDMGERQVGGLARRDGEGQADEVGGIGVSELVSVSKARMPVSRPRGPARPTASAIADRHIGAAVEGLGRGGLAPGRDEHGRRQRQNGVALSGRSVTLAGRAAAVPAAGSRSGPRADAVDGDRRGGNRAGVLAEPGGDAPGQGVELHRLQEGDQLVAVRLVDEEILQRHVERHVLLERHQLLRQPRLVGEGDEVLAALGLLDLAGALQQRLEVAVRRPGARLPSSARCRARPARCRSCRRPAPAGRSSSRDRRRTSPSPPRRRGACPSSGRRG